jgi:hypothetical protein
MDPTDSIQLLILGYKWTPKRQNLLSKYILLLNNTPENCFCYSANEQGSKITAKNVQILAQVVERTFSNFKR